MSTPKSEDRRDDTDPKETLSLSEDDFTAPGTISSAVLMGGRSQLAITHNQTTYILRQTRYGKLILTK